MDKEFDLESWLDNPSSKAEMEAIRQQHNSRYKSRDQKTDNRPRAKDAPPPPPQVPAQAGEVNFEVAGKDRIPKATCSNARIAIAKLGIDCRYDQFHDKLLVRGHVIGQHAGEFSDHACLVLRRLIYEKFKFDPGRNHTFDACVQLCLQNSFDPVADYLDGLKWDGTKRLDNWMRDYPRCRGYRAEPRDWTQCTARYGTAGATARMQVRPDYCSREPGGET